MLFKIGCLKIKLTKLQEIEDFYKLLKYIYLQPQLNILTFFLIFEKKNFIALDIYKGLMYTNNFLTQKIKSR